MSIRMYAYRKVHVEQREGQKPEERYAVRVDRGGKPVVGVNSDRITSIDAEVMRWEGANHIHRWFVENVQFGKHDGGHHHVDNQDLRNLLEVCERVLNGSHLVREPAFKASDWFGINRRKEARGTSPRMIKNISVAHRLLPVRCYDTSGICEYGEEYLKSVEVTRDWAEQTLIDESNGAPGNIYYTSGS